LTHSTASAAMVCMATAVRRLSSLMDCMVVYPLAGTLSVRTG
jgi:hypothetical protein